MIGTLVVVVGSMAFVYSFGFWCGRLHRANEKPRCGVRSCDSRADPRCVAGSCTYHCQSLVGCRERCLNAWKPPRAGIDSDGKVINLFP